MEDVRYMPGVIQTRAMGAELPEDDDDKYWIRVLASNDKLDKHNSIMDPETTLRNYEKDAKTKPGVALKDHHAYRSFGYGRSANAQLTDKNELFIDFYILKNMEYDAGSREFRTSEKLIRAIEHELVNQVSVGFFEGREICNLCQLPICRYSYWDWEPEREGQCTHKMGKMYDFDGKKEKATYTVFDARLKEVSLVEFGSNRNTAIEKKREIAEALEWVFTKKPGPAAGTPMFDGIRNFMEEHLMTDQEWITKLRDALGITNIKTTDEPDAVVDTLEAEVTSLREKVEEQKDEIADLTIDAEDGKAYRQARVDEGIKQGIRAHGDDFDEEYHREYYADLPLDKLEKAIESHKKIGDAKLPAGRNASDEHEPPPEKTQASARDRKRRGRRR